MSVNIDEMCDRGPCQTRSECIAASACQWRNKIDSTYEIRELREQVAQSFTAQQYQGMRAELSHKIYELEAEVKRLQGELGLRKS